MRVLLWAAAVLAVAGVPVWAQTPAVVNPTTVQFTPSADHDVINPVTTQPMVLRYDLRIFTEQPLGTVPVTTVDIGKPTPVGGTITVTNAVWFSGLTPNTRYVAKVAAVGPTGEGVSDPSGPFGNVGPPQRPSAPAIRQ